MTDSKLRREKINVMLNEEERRIITEKAIKYGFGDCLAEYIRAACIYENIYVEELNGKFEVCEKVSEFLTKIREIIKEQKSICMKITLSTEDVDKIKLQNKQIMDMIETLSHLVISSLSVNSIHKIQNRLSMIDKYTVDESFMKGILKFSTSIIRPSNLRHSNYKRGFLVNLPTYTIDIKRDEVYNKTIYDLIDKYRDIAMQKKMLLTFSNLVEEYITVGIASYFNHSDKANKFALDNNQDFILTIIPPSLRDKKEEYNAYHS